jgi:hypothetical protein
MKTLRTLCAATVLTFALTAPAFAGIITTDKTGTEPPPPSTSSMVTDGIITTDVASQSNTEGDATTASSSVTETALNLLQSVLSLF